MNIELKGADRPASVAVFGVNRVPDTSVIASGPATARAAGLLAVWSTIRLLTIRGWESCTTPFFWV